MAGRGWGEGGVRGGGIGKAFVRSFIVFAQTRQFYLDFISHLKEEK